MVRSSSQMDNAILFAELLELVRLEGSRTVGCDCMEKTEMREILLQEFDRRFRWYWLRCMDAGILSIGVSSHKPVEPQKVDGMINM